MSKQLYVVKLTFNNPQPTVRYLGEMGNCNKPLKDAKRMTKEEAEKEVSCPMMARLNPSIVPVKG